MFVTYEELREKIASGAEIIWVGTVDEKSILVRVIQNDTDVIYGIDPSALPKPSKENAVIRVEATKPSKSAIDVLWGLYGWLIRLRRVTVYGINVSGDCNTGSGRMAKLNGTYCTMGYDIETSMSLTQNDSFTPSYSKITSLAVWCTCGYRKAWTTIKHKPLGGLYYVPTSKRLVRCFIRDVAEHKPMWLVGYNCYQFDNCSINFHCPDDLRQHMRPIFSGSKAKISYSFYIDIVGVNNMDLYLYLDKLKRGKYKNLGLDTVAKESGLPGKLHMPSGEGADDVYALVAYNSIDSELTARLWHITGSCDEVIYLSVVSCSPVADCARLVSGTMSSDAISSKCISQNRLMDWSLCETELNYEGGTVLEPQRGLHKDVVVCDFSSMYPTIMIDMGLSPENIRIHDGKMASDRMCLKDWRNGNTEVQIGQKLVSFDSKNPCVTGDVLIENTTLRSEHKYTNPGYAGALKILSNSIFGAYGYVNSPLYSPYVAATITLAGRVAQATAHAVFVSLGMSVIYGDTDSCMTTHGKFTKKRFGGDVNRHADVALSILHRILSYMPFPNLKMEREELIPSMVLVDKKHYAYLTSDGKVKTKGLSHARKDRIGVSREMSGVIASTILMHDTLESARYMISDILNRCIGLIVSGSLDAFSVSKEVRYEGTTCYAFTDASGEKKYIPVTHADKVKRIDYNIDKVLDTVAGDVDRLCVPAGIGCVTNLLAYANCEF